MMQIAPFTRSSYDYSTLPNNVAEDARRARDHIRSIHRQAFIECGQILIEVKASLGHGHFTSWCDAELGFAPTTARNYMRAAEVFGDKPAIVAVLPPGALYVAAAAHDDVRAEIIRRVEAGENVRRSDVDQLVAVHRSDKRQEKNANIRRLRRQGLTEEQQKRHDRRLAREEREWQQRSDARHEAAATLLAKLQERFSIAEVKGIATLFNQAGLFFEQAVDAIEEEPS